MYGNWSGLKNDEEACMGDKIAFHYKRKQIRIKQLLLPILLLIIITTKDK